MDTYMYKCRYVYSYIFLLWLCAQLNRTAPSYYSSTPIGRTIPVLILLPMNNHLLPLLPACFCQGSHSWHRGGEMAHLLCLWLLSLSILFFSILFCDLSFKSFLKEQISFAYIFVYFFPRPARIFYRKYVCVFSLWDFIINPRYETFEWKAFELKMWSFSSL